MERRDLVKSAVEELARRAAIEQFVPGDPKSRPTPEQLGIIKDIQGVRIRIIPAGNRCLTGDTLIATPSGPRRLDEMQVGDTLYDEGGREQHVVKVWNNGEAEVADLTHFHTGEVLASCTPNHRWGEEKVEAVKLPNWGSNRRIEHVYNLTVSGDNNLFLLANGLVSSNSGKTIIICREISWILSNTHPYFKYPEKWQGRPLQLLLLGRTTKQIEESLHKYIVGFLEEGSYKVLRQGSVVQKVTHLGTGNSVLYLSHHDWRAAQEKAQSFTCDYAAIDEMPGSIKLVEEVQRRVMLNEGRFIMGFTPKRVNREMQKWVEQIRGKHSKVYKLLMLDNPAISEDEKSFILESLEGYSEEYRNAVLRGDFMGGDQSVFQLSDSMYSTDADLAGYSDNWPHIISVDPAISSKFGYTLWTRNPSQKWICVECGYIPQQERLDDYVSKLRAVVDTKFIVRRVCDPAGGWFLKLANGVGWTHVVPYAKNQGRKEELLTNFQRLLGVKLLISPHCSEVIDELSDMQWSESKEATIVASHRYHLFDTCAYLADCLPPEEEVTQARSYGEYIRAASMKERQSRGRPAVTHGGRVMRRIREWR